jgi:hypothetical protein
MDDSSSYYIAMKLIAIAVLPMVLLGLASIANAQQQQQIPQQRQVTPTTSVIHPVDVGCPGGEYEFNGKCVPL